MDINQIQSQIIEEFALFNEWGDKYEYLIELGKTVPAIEAQYKTAHYLIRGCQSQVWLRAELRDGVVAFSADSDAVITRGIIALLLRVLNHQPPQAIATAQLHFLDAIGLQAHLSPTRANGLASMVATLRNFGQQFAAQTA